MNASERQNILLAAAGKFLAGGGLGLFVLPPELNLVIARGEGSRVWDMAGRPQRNWPLRFKLAIPSIALVVAAIVVWAASGNRSAFLGIVLVAFACTTITDDFVQRRELRNNGV